MRRGSARPAPLRHAVSWTAALLVVALWAVAQQYQLSGPVVVPTDQEHHSHSAAAAAGPLDLKMLLANPLEQAGMPTDQTLQCVNYAGPMFFPYNPGGVNAPHRPVRVAKLPLELQDQPTLRTMLRSPLQPFPLSNVRLDPNSRAGAAQRTNTAFLKKLDADRLLYFFREISKVPQPRPGIQAYGGWESLGSGLRGEFIGHYLSAAASVVAATGDADLRARCKYIIEVLGQCQRVHNDGYLSAFPQAEFEKVESFQSRSPWVPYYVMHKLLAGLLDFHKLLDDPLALKVCISLAEHLRNRVLKILRQGTDRWYTFINQEVGGMSEVLTDLSVVTGNSTWIQLGALFERPCFIGPLALLPAISSPNKVPAADAIERMHANAHLPQLLGAMARYEASGSPTLRLAAEHFFQELHAGHTFVTGGSTSGEVWLQAQHLADPVMTQHPDNYWSHDHAETCVAHNSMRVSRRLMQWGAIVEDETLEHLLSHASYYERTLHNAVLGTQRGTLPGEMLYMMPMGSGVSKAGIPNAPQGHHWSDAEHHFWCCQGSGIEGFAKLADSIYWRHDPIGREDSNQIFVMQLLPSELTWDKLGVRITLGGDYPGSSDPAGDLVIQLSVRPIRYNVAESFILWVRIPDWVQTVAVRHSAGATPLQEAKQASLLPIKCDVTSGATERLSIQLRMSVLISWEKIKDARSEMSILQAPLYGPLALAGLTYGERVLGPSARLVPVSTNARTTLFSMLVQAPNTTSVEAVEGCLVTRWSQVWLVNSDHTRSFLHNPSALCIKRSTPIEDDISSIPQRTGPGYQLNEAQTRAACQLDGCLMPGATSPFASGALVLMHNGTGVPIVLAATPPVVPGFRRGGTDAANAATWRITTNPVGLHSTSTSSMPTDSVYVESFDRPGFVLSAGSKSDESVILLLPINQAGAIQRWRKVQEPSATLLESIDRPGNFISLKSTTSLPGPMIHRSAAASRRWQLQLGSRQMAANFDFQQPGYAEYPKVSFWAMAPSTHSSARPIRQTYLLFPLNEMVDEHYTVYFCKVQVDPTMKEPPRFCR